MWRNMTVLGKHQHVWSVLHRLLKMSDNHRCISGVFLLTSGLVSGCGCRGNIRGFSRRSCHTHSHTHILLLTWAHLPLLASGGKGKLSSLSFCSGWLQGDSGYKSKNTNSDPQEGAFAIHCSTSRVFFFNVQPFFFFFLIHKAAACKWGKTSPKSWRSKRRAAQQLQQRGGSAGTEGRSLRVVSADLTGKYAERWSVLPGLCWRGSKSYAGAFEED